MSYMLVICRGFQSLSNRLVFVKGAHIYQQSRLAIHMSKMAAKGSTAKPPIWIKSMDENTFSASAGWPSLVSELLEPVTMKDIDDNPENGKRVQGAFLFVPHMDSLLKQLPLMPNLKIVSNFGKGVDHIDVGWFKEKGITVTNTPDVLSAAVAELVFGLMLASARDLISGHKLATDKDTTNFRSQPLGVDVYESTMGILGLGSIGSEIAKRAKGFDIKVYYHSRNQRDGAVEEELGATYCATLHEMLALCDFFVIACPLSPQTHHLIGAKEFACMKPSATIVNIARGDIVDQDALVDALTTGKIRAAALDVTSPEPLPRDHPLLKLKNVTLTPHVGSATTQTRRKMTQTVLLNLKAMLIDDTPVPNPVSV